MLNLNYTREFYTEKYNLRPFTVIFLQAEGGCWTYDDSAKVLSCKFDYLLRSNEFGEEGVFVPEADFLDVTVELCESDIAWILYEENAIKDRSIPGHDTLTTNAFKRFCR